MPRLSRPFSQIVRRNTHLARVRVEAVFKQSVQDVLRDASVPTAQGGNMRVDTGFLRNSLCVNLNSPAMGPSSDGGSVLNVEDAILVVGGATVNDVIWAGWSANYARPREYKDGFRESAVQKWPKFVRQNVARAIKEIN
jgi:hypothetical protein